MEKYCSYSPTANCSLFNSALDFTSSSVLNLFSCAIFCFENRHLSPRHLWGWYDNKQLWMRFSVVISRIIEVEVGVIDNPYRGLGYSGYHKNRIQ